MDDIKKGNARIVFDFEYKGNGIMTSVGFMIHEDCKLNQEEVFMALAQGVSELAEKFEIDFDEVSAELNGNETIQ